MTLCVPGLRGDRCIENVGHSALGILIGSNSGDYQEIDLFQWMAANPGGTPVTESVCATTCSPICHGARRSPRNSSHRFLAPAVSQHTFQFPIAFFRRIPTRVRRSGSDNPGATVRGPVLADREHGQGMLSFAPVETGGTSGGVS
jgi:hypothetical protein